METLLYYQAHCIYFFIVLGRPMNIQLATSDISGLGRLGGGGGLGGRRNTLRQTGNRPNRGNHLILFD